MKNSSEQESVAELQEYNMDHSVCTPLELKAWYSFGVAAEGFSAMAVSVFFPLILQSLAANEAFKSDNHKIKCNTTDAYKCDVNIGGKYIDTSALVLYATTISVFIQFILFSILGSVADYGPNRKKFLMFFGVSTGLVGFCMIFVVNTSMYLMAFLIYIVSNTFFGASFVFYYAWVPILARYSPEVLEAETKSTDLAEKHLVSERVSNEISSKGFFYGYMTGVAQIILSSVFVLYIGSGTAWNLPEVYPMQMCVAAVCVWEVAVLLGFTGRHLKSRPGPPLPAGKNYIVFSIQNLAKTLSEARQQPELFKFLIAWFLYSDAFCTVVSIAILFAQAELGASNIILLASAVIVPLGAGIGNILWVRFQNHYQLSTIRILIMQACLYLVMPVYGLLGFFTPIGLRTASELLPLAVYHGLLLGATQSSCRVLFSELLPPGHEAEFFGLYEITDKGSAWVGPLMVALITQFTGNMRYSFVFIGILFFFPIFIFSNIDVAKGKKEAKAYSDKTKALKLS
ncbi:autophagy-related protein 22-like protein [Globomyces pollinis-pini]|nr:autophagy-related protein 22-like protein [Globomyces pollinis-pini]